MTTGVCRLIKGWHATNNNNIFMQVTMRIELQNKHLDNCQCLCVNESNCSYKIHWNWMSFALWPLTLSAISRTNIVKINLPQHASPSVRGKINLTTDLRPINEEWASPSKGKHVSSGARCWDPLSAHLKNKRTVSQFITSHSQFFDNHTFASSMSCL